MQGIITAAIWYIWYIFMEGIDIFVVFAIDCKTYVYAIDETLRLNDEHILKPN